MPVSSTSWAQQPTPLFNAQPVPPFPPSPPGTADQSFPAQAPPPADPSSPQAVTPDQAPPAQAAAPPVPGRVFCEQAVTAQVADPNSVPERYRQFAGIFSDADWNPQTCAALIVESIGDDGIATVTYVFGPIVSGGKGTGGVLHGTGIVKDGTLLFQNADGSQYAFKPFYSDLAGKWTTPKGQTYEAVFKRSF